MPKDLLANATAALATGLETGDVQPLLDELHLLLHEDLVLLTVLVFAPFLLRALYDKVYEILSQLAHALVDKLLKLSCWVALKAWPCLDPCFKIYDRCYHSLTRRTPLGRILFDKH